MSENNTLSTTYTNIEEIEKGEKLLAEVRYKNNMGAYVMIPVAIALIITRNVFCIVFAVLVLLASYFAITKVRDKKVMDVYNNCVILYDDKDESLGLRINPDDILEWTLKDSNQNGNSIDITLTNGERLSKVTFQTVKGYNAMRDLVPAKESRVIQLNKVAKANLKSFSLDEIFKKRKK